MDNYKLFNSNLQNHIQGHAAFYNSHNSRFQVYPKALAEALVSCREFKTLDDHARAYLRRQLRHALDRPARSPVKKLLRFMGSKVAEYGGELPLAERDIRELRHRLESCLEDGFLISEEALHKKLLNCASEVDIPKEEAPPAINILGIPTRNRGALLARCVLSYLENLRQHSRQCVFHIVDDSDAGQSGRAVAETLARHRIPVLWADRPYRRQLAGRLAQAAEVPEEVTQFALLGDARCGLRTGASRNALLLLAAGQPSVQVDDDTICRITPSPGRESGITVSSEHCNQYWFYTDFEAAIKQAQFEDIDFLSLHESLLGWHPGSLVERQEPISVDRLGGRLLETLGQPEARTAVTFLGGLGDSGMFRHWQRLCADEYSFRRLTKDGSAYRNHLRTRQLFRGPAQLSIGDGPFCMAMNIGLDSSRILPPFMPVQRRQDGVFGLLLHLCFQQTCRGYLPWAILHCPPGRSSHIGRLHTLSTGPLRTNDILEAVLWTLNSRPWSTDPAHNLKVAGRYLLDLSRLPPRHAKARLREACLQQLRRQSSYLERCIHERIDAPEYWQRDARQVVSDFQQWMLREDLGLPSDLMGNTSERLNLLQQLIGKFGRLLIHWPEIWEAAAYLREEEGWGANMQKGRGTMDNREWDVLSDELMDQAKDHIGPVKKAPKIRRKNVSVVAPFFLLRQKMKKNEQVRGLMATYPARKRPLLNTIDSIIDQVQELFIYLNDYSVEEYEELRNSLPDKCVLLPGSHEAGNVLDSGKFYMSGKLTGYHLALDDDLIYPPDFVRCMVCAHQKLRKADASPLAVGMHGRRIQTFPVRSYFKDTETYHFQRGLKHHTQVDILGTGGVLFHRDELDMRFEQCKTHGMADIWFSIACLEQGLSRYVIAHPDEWVRQQPVEESLYTRHRNHDKQQTEIVNRFDWGSGTHAERETASPEGFETH